MRAQPRKDPSGPGQESVWDYPRPPALRRCREQIQIRLGGRLIYDGSDAWQVLETSHPPTYYLPRAAFVPGSLREAGGSSYCEWKGEAAYLDVLGGGKTARRAAWHYPGPTPRYASLRGHVALYPGQMDYCLVDGERVEPQPGTFYGGWITSAVVGPFKGGPGSQGW